MNLYKSKISVFEIIQYEQTLNTYTSDGTSKKLSNTQEQIRQQCWLVCVHSQLHSHTVYDTLHSRCKGHGCKEPSIAPIYAYIQKYRQVRYHCQRSDMTS